MSNHQYDVESRNQLFENIIINNWNAIVFANMEGIVEYVNPAANKLYGYSGDELLGKNVDVFNSHLTLNTEEIVQSIINTGSWTGELIQRRKDNSTFLALLSVQLINDQNGVPIGYASNSKDISEDKETRKKLKQIIQEKEVLLGELHHRVKNNLNLLQSILRIQIDKTEGLDVKDFLNNYLARVSAIGDLHNTIYRSDNLSEVNVANYLEILATNIRLSFSDNGKDINFNENYKDTVKLNLQKVVPIGLIANEVLTNSFKHAFSNKKEGEIKIELYNNQGEVTLYIKDNGQGFNVSKPDKSSMGMWLINELADQISADYKFENNNGTIFSLKFQS